jgi:hypothetical protein
MHVRLLFTSPGNDAIRIMRTLADRGGRQLPKVDMLYSTTSMIPL